MSGDAFPNWPNWGEGGITFICYEKNKDRYRALIRHYSERSFYKTRDQQPTFSGYIYDPGDPEPHHDVAFHAHIEGRLFGKFASLQLEHGSYELPHCYTAKEAAMLTSFYLHTAARLGLPEDVKIDSDQPQAKTDKDSVPFRVHFMISPQAEGLSKADQYGTVPVMPEDVVGMQCGWATRETIKSHYVNWIQSKKVEKITSGPVRDMLNEFNKRDTTTSIAIRNNMRMIPVYRCDFKDLVKLPPKSEWMPHRMYAFADAEWTPSFMWTRSMSLEEQARTLQALGSSRESDYWKDYKKRWRGKMALGEGENIRDKVKAKEHERI
jgi:hypothetical protein